MTHVLDLLIRGRQNVVGHYRLLLPTEKAAMARRSYGNRLDLERCPLNELQSSYPDRVVA